MKSSGEYVHTKRICSHEGNMFTRREYVHTKRICSHKGNMFTRSEYVHTKGIRSKEGNMFTRREYVHTKGICSHEGIMCGFTCAYSACGQSSIFEIITIHHLLLFVAHFCIIVMCILALVSCNNILLFHFRVLQRCH